MTKKGANNKWFGPLYVQYTNFAYQNLFIIDKILIE
jgi:hypothetical protein